MKKSKEADLNDLKKSVKEYYDSLTAVYCPYFSEEVFFTGKGFKHLIYKSSLRSQRREIWQQKERLLLFHISPKLISITTTVQEFEERDQTIRYSKKRLTKKVSYWGFIAIIDDSKVKVIVRKVGSGKLHFWSIFPNWKTRLSKE